MKEETDLFSLFITAIQNNLFKVTISHSKGKMQTLIFIHRILETSVLDN